MYEAAVAYRVPFDLVRRPPRYLLVNSSAERIDGVTLTLHGAGMLAANLPATLEPHEALDVVVVGRQLAQAAILVVRWFRPDGVEYLWRVSF